MELALILTRESVLQNTACSSTNVLHVGQPHKEHKIEASHDEWAGTHNLTEDFQDGGHGFGAQKKFDDDQ